MGAHEQVVLSSYGHRTDFILLQVFVDLQAALGRVDGQLIPVFEVVGQRMSYRTFGVKCRQLLGNPRLELGQERHADAQNLDNMRLRKSILFHAWFPN